MLHYKNLFEYIWLRLLDIICFSAKIGEKIRNILCLHEGSDFHDYLDDEINMNFDYKLIPKYPNWFHITH